jgi:hypothetical protein
MISDEVANVKERIYLLRIENNSFSRYHFGALGSEEKISRCRHKIRTEIACT